ncbi:MAG TPA: TetR/AcrR family transcriptional regulator [Mucilaginibacter sp.]|nr:TetR/AcrR family transcriptional regulator [Mucilaginibacter sp.]
MEKEEIVEAVLERFMQYGIRSMTIKKLVEPLGISTKTVYKYFNSKEELLEECLRVLYTGYFNEFNAILSGKDNPVNTLLIIFRSTLGKDFGVSHAFFHDLNYYYPELQNAAINQTRENYGSLMIPLVKDGIEQGYFNDFIIPEIALSGIATLYTSITRSDNYKGFELSPYELFKNLVEIYMRGMCTEKGLKEIENNPYHK